MMRTLLAAMVLLVGVARAEAPEFYGNWENAGHDESGITHVVISPAGGNDASVRVYGDCHPVECNWGLVEGRAYTGDPQSGTVESIVAELNFGFAHREIIFRKAGKDRLSFEVLTDFTDGSEKHDFDTTGMLRRSAWAGPLNQNWERPGMLATGWGGGDRDGVSPKPRESCVRFDPRSVHIVPRGSLWKIAAGSQVFAEAKTEQLAQRAEDTIRHYRFDRICRTGTSVYWRRGDRFPDHKVGGADCVSFNSTTVHTAHVGHSWKVVDGVQWIAGFEAKADADALLAMIRARHLDAECFVARPDPVLIYWIAY